MHNIEQNKIVPNKKKHVEFLQMKKNSGTIFVSYKKRKPKKEKRYKNQIAVNSTDYFFGERVGFSYERLIKSNQGILIHIVLHDGGLHPSNYNTQNISVGIGYVGYFSKKYFHVVFINPYLAYRKNYPDESGDL